MNKRIKDLWGEATESVWPRPGKFTAGEYDYHLEKFAELIVREYIFHGILSIARNHPDGRVVTISFKTSKDATEFEQHAIESTKNISE